MEKIKKHGREVKIKFEDLLGLTIGQLGRLTEEFVRQNPDFTTADEILSLEDVL